ncbi:TonB-dependent receptor plug domain-containing protein [uncultured Draconibacterium sp.]|uniref:TonB-dependent receptor plug domain-containing protein n=1 Tax=uncultured Draconibacterium sp. TaxID=1573823 RepID=UPI002AA75DF8|nr:TonB-dependent receptor plug domain-containing protein [uncultured Draconibacterium sp.]
MEDFILYIGKAALALGAFYLAYLALFQHQKHFFFNRIYLPVSFLVSFLIPLITFTKVNYIQPIPAATSTGFAYLPEAAVASEPQFNFEWYHYLLGIYALGIVVFMLNLLIGHLKAMNIIRFSRLKELFGAQVNLTKKDVHPFSFFSRIVLSERTLKNPDLKMIVDHEMIHVRERHTLDILFAELLFLFQWFNPFAWLTRDAMRNNLEYLTDHQVAQNHNAEAYQLAMVGLAHKKGVAPFLTALNGSQLKNRIIMMKKKTENRYSLMKQLVVLPLLAILVMGLSNKEVKTEIVQEAAQSVQITDVTQLIYHQISLSGIVTDENGNLIGGVEIYSQNGNLVAQTGENGKFRISPEDNEKSFIVAKEGYRSTEIKNDTGKSKEQLLIQLDRIEKSPKGKVISGKITNEGGDGLPAVAVLVKGTNIGTISDVHGNYEIKTDENNTLLFSMVGHERKEVAIDGKTELNVQLKSDGSETPEQVKVIGYGKMNEVPRVDLLANSENPPLYIVDGKEFKNIDWLESDEIETIDVLKGESAKILYKEKGKNGVIAITTKAAAKDKTDEVKVIGYGEQKTKNDPLERVRVHISGNSEDPLYIVDGKPIADINSIDPNDIESVSVLKGEQATALYGSVGGKNGVVIVTTKEAAKAKMEDAVVLIEGIPYDGDINDIDPETIESMEVLKGESATERFGPVAKDGAVSIKLKGSTDFGGKSPLIILDGEKYTGDMDDIDPNDIESITVLKDASAIETYGEDAKDGVILINTKSEEITSELDLRRFIAKRIKYPTKAVEKGSQGTVQAFVEFGKENKVVSIHDYKQKNIEYLEDVVVVGYAKNGVKQPTDDEVMVPELVLELKRVLEQLPSVDIKKFKGKAVGVSVKFVLQEK